MNIYYNNWKAPHKNKASDLMCSIFEIKRQRYLPYFDCMQYCIKRAETIHTKVRQMSFILLFHGLSWRVLRNNACKQCVKFKLCTCITFLWSLPFTLSKYNFKHFALEFLLVKPRTGKTEHRLRARTRAVIYFILLVDFTGLAPGMWHMTPKVKLHYTLPNASLQSWWGTYCRTAVI